MEELKNIIKNLLVKPDKVKNDTGKTKLILKEVLKELRR